MITVDINQPNVHLTINDQLSVDDFKQLADKMAVLRQSETSWRLLIDARHFHGWQNIKAMKAHVAFVRAHHRQIERVALVIGYQWQRWLASIVKIFLHPHVKIFNADDYRQAEQWYRTNHEEQHDH